MSASYRRVSDLLTEVEDGRLVVRPFFQRRLVWTNADKENLIDTVLHNYPFPEIFIATGKLELSTGKRTNWLVDGQQRISTLRSYVSGSTDLLYKKVPRFRDLTPAEQTTVHNYEIAVRDLGTVDESTIREIFRRINSTDYALKSMEKLNAMFNGAYNKYCDDLSNHEFFERHKVFPASARKRMYDVTFCVILVTTILAGYYRRDEMNEEYLERYNDEFPQADEVQASLEHVFDFVEQCGFAVNGRAWKQTDLFTLLVELHSALFTRKLNLTPSVTGAALQEFYEQVDEIYLTSSRRSLEEIQEASRALAYLKAATKATNDKYARIERAEIISAIITSTAGGAPSQKVPKRALRKPKAPASRKAKRSKAPL